MRDMIDDATPLWAPNVVEAFAGWSGWRAGPTANRLVAADNQSKALKTDRKDKRWLKP
jgi:hypothetical protein